MDWSCISSQVSATFAEYGAPISALHDEYARSRRACASGVRAGCPIPHHDKNAGAPQLPRMRRSTEAHACCSVTGVTSHCVLVVCGADELAAAPGACEGMYSVYPAPYTGTSSTREGQGAPTALHTTRPRDRNSMHPLPVRSTSVRAQGTSNKAKPAGASSALMRRAHRRALAASLKANCAASMHSTASHAEAGACGGSTSPALHISTHVKIPFATRCFAAARLAGHVSHPKYRTERAKHDA